MEESPADQNEEARARSSEADLRDEPRTDAHVPDTPTGDVRRHGLHRLWDQYRVAIVGAVVGVLALQVFSPVRDTFFGVADGLHDIVISVGSFEAGRVDNLKERVEARPFWTAEPTWFDDSLDYLRQGYGDAGLYATAFGQLTVVTPDDLARDAVEYRGRPIILVGRVTDRTSLGGEVAYTYSVTELRMTGRAPEPFVFSGLGGEPTGVRLNFQVGEVVALGGLVTAKGQANTPDGPIQTAYFTAVDEFGLDGGFSAIERAAKKIRRSSEGESSSSGS